MKTYKLSEKATEKDLIECGYIKYFEDDNELVKDFDKQACSVRIYLDSRNITYDNDILDIFDWEMDEFNIDLIQDLIKKGLVEVGNDSLGD